MIVTDTIKMLTQMIKDRDAAILAREAQIATLHAERGVCIGRINELQTMIDQLKAQKESSVLDDDSELSTAVADAQKIITGSIVPSEPQPTPEEAAKDGSFLKEIFS